MKSDCSRLRHLKGNVEFEYENGSLIGTPAPVNFGYAFPDMDPCKGEMNDYVTKNACF